MTENRFLERAGEPRILYRLDAARGVRRGRVVVVHGFAEHSGRYDRVVDLWTHQGLDVARLDLRGHGGSDGVRGHASSIDEYVSDVTALLRELESCADFAGPGKPIIFGHSMGGLIATHVAFTHEHTIAGLALTSPFFDVAKPVPALQVLLGKVAAKVAPRLRQPSGLKGSDCTHDAAIARAYDEDPLSFHHVTAGWFVAISAAQRDALDRAPTLFVPLFCIAAGEDRVVSLRATKRFFALAGSTEKELDVRPGLFHEVLNELDWKDHATHLAERMLRWASG